MDRKILSLSEPADFEYSYDIGKRQKRVFLYLSRVPEVPDAHEVRCDPREIVGYEFVPVGLLQSYMKWDEDKQLARDIFTRLSR